MPAHFNRFLAACVAAASMATLGAGAALADQAPPAAAAAQDSCFFVNQWDGGWRSPSPNVIYIKVGLNDIYRLDLSAGSSQLDDQSNHLVNIVRGSDSICSALDFDLYVADYHGFREPLIVKSMRKLTPAEVAAIPAKYRP